MELRSLDVILPVEIPHCGELDQKLVASIAKKVNELGRIYVYDVCELAFMERKVPNTNQSIFCNDLDECYNRFRTVDIKVLAVIYSRFEEVMLIDAHTLLLQNPMSLWDTTKSQTGTLFFNDRISQTNTSLNHRPASRPHVPALRHYLSSVDVSGFRHLPTIPREQATVVSDMKLPFKPSDMLLKSHPWNGRSSHQMDSSLLLWSKKRQPRATVVLASFISLNGMDRPPFDDDKELFFVACELAETQYSFSEYAKGAAGNVFRDNGADKSTICGLSAQFYPVKQEDASSVSLLFLHSDAIMNYEPRNQSMYFSKARVADVSSDSHSDQEVLSVCAFNATGVALSEAQIQRVRLRQSFHAIAAEWEQSAFTNGSEHDMDQADEVIRKKLEIVMKIPFSNGVSANKGTVSPATVTSLVVSTPPKPSPVIATPPQTSTATVPARLAGTSTPDGTNPAGTPNPSGTSPDGTLYPAGSAGWPSIRAPRPLALAIPWQLLTRSGCLFHPLERSTSSRLLSLILSELARHRSATQPSNIRGLPVR